MHGLAQYVMTGRRQAIIAVLLLGLIPLVNLLNPVVVGLVALRKGPREAAILFAWAVLPVAAWAVAGDVVPLMMLLGISCLAILLRESESWELVLLAAIAVGLMVEFYFRLQPAVLDALISQVDVYLQNNNQQGIDREQVRTVMLSIMGAVYMFLSIMLLMLARWMQAKLFNPGGFQEEIHALRIEQKVALGLVTAMLLISFGGFVPSGWILYLVLPLIISGVALVHGVVALKKLSGMWLVTFYLVLMLPYIVQFLVLLALVDSWYDFRSRLRSSV